MKALDDIMEAGVQLTTQAVAERIVREEDIESVVAEMNLVIDCFRKARHYAPDGSVKTLDGKMRYLLMKAWTIV